MDRDVKEAMESLRENDPIRLAALTTALQLARIRIETQAEKLQLLKQDLAKAWEEVLLRENGGK